MSRKKYRVFLSKKKRKYLKELVSKGTDKARKLTRARILLLADEGPYGGPCKTDKWIIESMGVSAFTVAKTRQRYATEGLEFALNEKPRSGRPPKFTGRDEAMLTAIACSDPPEGYGRWSVRLLSDNLVELGVVESISRETVRLMLKRGI
jgi:transposase